MGIDDKRFYPSNWQDFIPKGAITELFKAVPEIEIHDLQAAGPPGPAVPIMGGEKLL